MFDWLFPRRRALTPQQMNRLLRQVNRRVAARQAETERLRKAYRTQWR